MNLVENCLESSYKNVVMQHFGKILSKVFELLENSHLIVKENAVTLISALAIGLKDYEEEGIVAKILTNLFDLSERLQSTPTESANTQLIQGMILEAETRVLEYVDRKKSPEYPSYLEDVYRKLAAFDYKELRGFEKSVLRNYIGTSWDRILYKKNSKYFEQRITEVKAIVPVLFDLAYEFQKEVFSLYSGQNGQDEDLEKEKEERIDAMESDLKTSISVMARLCDVFPKHMADQALGFYGKIVEIFQISYEEIGIEYVSEQDSIVYTGITNIPYVVRSVFYQLGAE